MRLKCALKLKFLLLAASNQLNEYLEFSVVSMYDLKINFPVTTLLVQYCLLGNPSPRTTFNALLLLLYS